MKKKLYISLPIAIDEKTVAKRYRESLEYISNDSELSSYEIVGPINIHHFGDNGLEIPREHEYSWYVGEDIKILLECDAIFMSNGWSYSKGCTAELHIAKIYGLETYFMQ